MSAPATPSILVRPGAYDGYLQFFWYDQGDPTIEYYTLTCTGVYTDSSFPPFNNSGMRYSAGLLTYKMDTGYLTNGVKYTFSITATNENGISQPATFRTVAPGVKPQPVASVSAVTYSDTSALVTWVSSGTVAVPPVEWFVAQAISCNGADPLIQRSQYPYQSNVVLSSLNAASQYTFNVYAVNDPGYSPVAVTSTLTTYRVNASDLIVYLTAESYPGYGQWHDRSGNNYNAAIETGTAAVNADKNGLVLNGSTNWRFPPTGPSGIGSYSNFTLQTWYKQIAATGNGAAVVTEVFTGTTVNMAIQQGGYTSTNTDMVGGFFSDGKWNTGPPFPVANDEWHNLAVTFNGSQLISYFDGYAIASNSYSNAYSASNNYYRIGRRWDITSNIYLQGEIGQVLIYGRALSSAEVLQNVSSYVPVFPAVLQDVALSTLRPADTTLTLTWNQAPATKAVEVTFYQTAISGDFANGSTLAASVFVNPPYEFKTLAVPLTRGYYYYGTAGLPGGTAYSSATAYYDYPTLSNAAMTNVNLYTTTLGTAWSTNANYITGIQLYSNATNATSNRAAIGSLISLSTAQNSYSFPTSNYPSPLSPDTWISADVTPFSTTRTVTATPVKVAGPTYTNFTVSTISVGDTSLSAKWTPSIRYPTNVQFYITTTATRPSGTYSTVGSLQYIENSSLSSITLNVVPSTGLYYFAGITYSTGSLSTFTTPVVVPNAIQTVTLSSLSYQSQSLDTSWTAVTPSAVTLSYYSTSTAVSTGGTLLSSFSIPSGTTSNSFPTLPYAGAYYYATVRKTGSPAVASTDAKRGVNPLSTLSLSTLTAYASNLTASWLSAYNSTIALSFYDGTGLLSTVATSNGTSNYTLDYNPYPSTVYYIKAAFGTQPYLSTVAAAMPNSITNVSLDQLTTDSTDLSCSWSAAPSTAVTVRYYSTTSATVPATRSQVGTTQTVDATLSTNSLAPAIAPLSSFFYYVGVTPTRGPEVVSAPAFQPIDANLSTATKGSIAFTGGWLTLTSNWTLPVSVDAFTVEAFISTTKPLITTQRDDPNGSENEITYWGDYYRGMNSFYIQTPDNVTYYLANRNNQQPGGDLAAVVPTIVDGGWHHVVAQGAYSTYSMYYDGKFMGRKEMPNYSTTTDFTNFTVGAFGPPYNFFKGFMTNVRIVNGINVYSGSNSNAANFTVPTQLLTATQASSSNIAAITGVNQNAAIGAVGSLQITGGGGQKYIAPTTAVSSFSNVDWTYESWVNFNNNTNQKLIACINGDGSSAIYAQLRIQQNNSGGSNFIQLLSRTIPGSEWGQSNSFNVAVGPAMTSNTWYHIAAVRQGPKITWYNNGVSTFSYAIGTATYQPTNSTYTTLGGAVNNNDFDYTGEQTNMRLVVGTAVYTSNFTPPTTPLSVIANTQFLLKTAPGNLLKDSASNYTFVSSYNATVNTSFNSPFPRTSVGNNYTALLLNTNYDTPFLDGSSNAFTLTSNGAVAASRENPFGAVVYPTRVPDAPTNVVGSPGNAQVTVTWSLPLSNGGTVITSYTVTASPGAIARTINGAAVSSYVFTGLTNGTAYTFTVYATNSKGNSAASVASAAVTPAAAAAEPTALVATHGDASASIAFTAGATGGGTISNYKYSTDGGSSFTAFSPAQTASPVSITGLTNGTTYSVALRAVTQVGDGTASSNVSVTPSTVPGAPTEVLGSRGNTSVALTWSAPANDGGDTIDSYTAAYSTDGTNYTVFGSTFPSASGTVTGLTNGTAYTFKVSAHNANGDSVYSTASAAVTPSTVPGAPTDITGTRGNTSVALNWLAPSSTGGADIDYYVVEYSSGGGYTAFEPTFPSTSGTVTGLTNGTAYTFRVSAHNLNGLSSPSAPSSPVTPSTVPGAPTAVSGTSGNTEVSVAWTAPSSDGGAAISSYTVKYSTDGSTYTAFGSTFVSSPGVVTGLANGTAYTFKVFATNANGNSDDSTASAAVTPSTTPGAPTAVFASQENGQATVFWSPPSNDGGANITSYTVKYSSDGSTYTAFGSTFSLWPGVVTGLTNGTAYTFKVFATNTKGNSTDSTASTAVTPSTVSHLMVWDPAKKGTDAVVTAEGLGLYQLFGYRQAALATRVVATGERVLYSIQPVQIGPFQTMTVGWGTSNMHYNGTGDAYSGYPGTDDQSVGVDFYGSSFYNSTAQVTQLPVYSTVGDVVDMALHDGVGWWIRVNGGLWNNDSNANPATDVGGLSVQGLTALFPAANPAGGGRADGALLLLETSTYTVPSGYTFI